MKKLFLIVAAMFAAVSFSACSDDDDNGGKAPTPEKWVKQIVFRAEWDESWTSTITYDSENRVKKINGLRNDSYEFTYNGNSRTDFAVLQGLSFFFFKQMSGSTNI